MSDDYLWDGSGEPDPEVERLERLLATLRSDRPAPELPENLGLRKRSVLFRHSIQLAVAGAAAVALSIVHVADREEAASVKASVTELATRLPRGVALLVGGAGGEAADGVPRAVRFHDLPRLDAWQSDSGWKPTALRAPGSALG